MKTRRKRLHKISVDQFLVEESQGAKQRFKIFRCGRFLLIVDLKKKKVRLELDDISIGISREQAIALIAILITITITITVVWNFAINFVITVVIPTT